MINFLVQRSCGLDFSGLAFLFACCSTVLFFTGFDY